MTDERDADGIGGRLWKVALPVVAVLAGIVLVQEGLQDRDSGEGAIRVEEAPRPERHIPPEQSFREERQRAREAWEAGDGFWTTINEPGDMSTRSVWKTAERRDDGTPGIAPVVRTRLSAGHRVLLYGRPVVTKGVEMWKLTDGDTYGWISEMQLDSVPDGPL